MKQSFVILEDSDKRLHQKCVDVVFPLSKERKKLIKDMVKYLRLSQDEEYSEKYDIRPGMGLAAPQLGINENFFVVVLVNEDGTSDEYIVINPKIVSTSKEKIYAGSGEGCLSVNRPVDGYVPRHARISLEAYDLDGKLQKIRVREEEAIAFEHELDHLEGILFYEKVLPEITDEDIRMI